MLAEKKKNWLFTGIIMCHLLCLCTYASAKEERAEKEGKTLQESRTIETKTIKGEVGTIRPGYITVIYGKEKRQDGSVADFEIVIPLDGNVKLTHIKTIDVLKEGDTVEITAEETRWVDEDDIGRSERKAKEIRFISPAKTGLSSGI